MAIKVGINGFGRIGRNVLRSAVLNFGDDIEIVAINDLLEPDYLAYMLKYDSVHGRFKADVAVQGNDLLVNGKKIRLTQERDPANLKWDEVGADVVLEATGLFLTKETAQKHIDAGAKKVIMSAPSKDDTPMFVYGVNDKTYAGQAIISNASCTTNCLAPLAKVINDKWGIKRGLMTTVHAATATQKVVDAFGGSKNRATLNNIIPASTGAAKAVGKVLPHLDGKLNGTALRVPTDTGSVVEAVFLIEGQHDAGAVMEAMQANIAAMNASTILGLVAYLGDWYECSRDCVGEPWSSMIRDDLLAVPAGGNTLIKATSFYDNEVGFSHRMAELALLLAGGG